MLFSHIMPCHRLVCTPHVRVLYPYQPAISEAFVLPPYPYHGVVVPSPGYFTSLQSGVSPGISMSDARQPYDPASPKTRYTILEPSEARISVPRVERTREDGDSGEVCAFPFNQTLPEYIDDRIMYLVMIIHRDRRRGGELIGR